MLSVHVGMAYITNYIYSKTCVKRPLSKRPKIGFQDQVSLNAGQKYCRMLQGLQFVFKIFVLSIFEWPFHTGFTVKPKKGNPFRNNANQAPCAFILHLPLYNVSSSILNYLSLYGQMCILT